MKVYVVYADTYEDSYGCQISLFGVYDSFEKAEIRIKKLNKETDILYGIEELTINEYKEIYLGGYYE